MSSLNGSTLTRNLAIRHPVADSSSRWNNRWHRWALKIGGRPPLHYALTASVLSLTGINNLSRAFVRSVLASVWSTRWHVDARQGVPELGLGLDVLLFGGASAGARPGSHEPNLAVVVARAGFVKVPH